MPTRKIRDIKEYKRCFHPSHNPPNMEVFTPGVYEHECPACHHKVEFVVRNTFCQNTTKLQQLARAQADTHAEIMRIMTEEIRQVVAAGDIYEYETRIH